MTPHTLPDIVGPVTQKLTATKGLRARFILFNASTSGGGTAAVVGDAAADATHGAHLQPNVPVIYPMNGADATATYDLSQLTAYVPSGTTLTTTYFT